MINIAYEYSFIFGVLIFYGFLFTLYALNGGSLYGLTSATLTYAEPATPTGNGILDFLNGVGASITLIVSFFTTLFITPFTAGTLWSTFAFINWAIFGTMIYIFIRTVRGGG